MPDVRADGAGPPVVLVHGGSSGADDWERVARHLAERFRVLRYTRYTCRTAPPPLPHEAMAGEINDLLTVAAAAGEPVIAVGHSSGAVVVLESARAEPHISAPRRIAGIIAEFAATIA